MFSRTRRNSPATGGPISRIRRIRNRVGEEKVREGMRDTHTNARRYTYTLRSEKKIHEE